MNVQASQRKHQCTSRPVVGAPEVSGAAEVVVPRGFEHDIALASRRDMDYPMAQKLAVAIVEVVRGGLAD